MQGWDVVCQRILNQPLSIWHGFLQPLFISRVKVGNQNFSEIFYSRLFSSLISATFESPIILFFFLIVQLSDGKLQKVLPQIVNVCKYCWSHMLLNSKTKWLYMISVKFGPVVQKLCQVYCIIFLLLRRVAIRYIFHLFIPLNTGITNWKYQMSKVTLHLEFNQNQSKMCIFFSF